jgi:hypothetical protein
LRIVAEEFVSTRADVPADRQRELRGLLEGQLPAILTALFALVDSGTAAQSLQVCRINLETLSQLFSWVPLSEHVTPSRLASLCRVTVDHCGDELGLLALGCLNELLSKNYVPLEFSDFLRVCFNHITTLLELIAAQGGSEGNGAFDDDETYVDKTIQFTLSFFTNHLSRVEGADGFDMPRLLGLLFTVTYGRPAPPASELLRGAECWDFFVEYVQSNRANEVLLSSYADGLSSVLDAAVPSLLFELNGEMLEELLEDETEQLGGMGEEAGEADEGGEEEAAGRSELAEFQATGIELAGKIVDLYPQAGMAKVFSRWQSSWGTFTAAASGGDVVRTTALARDVALLLQIWGRLAEQLVLQFTDPEWMAFAEQLVASIVDVGVFAAEHAEALQACGAPGVLMHAQVFGTLTGLTGWLERHVAAARDGDAAAEVRLDAVVDRLLTVASPALGEEMPPVVSSAAGTISQPYISDFGGHAVHS